jgi:hypothetical protein
MAIDPISGARTTNIQPDSFQYLDADSLLTYCKTQLRQSDDRIKDQMSRLEGMSKASAALTKLASRGPGQMLSKEENERREVLLKQFSDKEIDLLSGDPDMDEEISDAGLTQARIELRDLDNKQINAYNASVEEAAQALESSGNYAAADTLRASPKPAIGQNGEDFKKKTEDFKKTVDGIQGNLGASKEMAMVTLSASVAQRGTMLQMITNMMSALNETQKAIASNTGR